MKKKILLIIGIILILIMCIIAGGYIYLKQRDDTISLINDNIIIEYGKTYNPTVEELIDLNRFNFIDLKKVKLESSIKNEDDKEYPPVGEYQIVVRYNEKNLVQKVVVRDTTSPELSIQEKIEIANGTDLSTYNFKDFIKTTDLSELKNYNIDFTNVNSNIAGEYNAKISIEDIYSNKTEKEFKIIIPELPVETVVKKEASVQIATKDFSGNKNTSVSSQSSSKRTTQNKQENEKNTQQSTTPSQNVQTPTPSNDTTKPKCNHDKTVGNSKLWFPSQASALKYYEDEVLKYKNEKNSGAISYQEYLQSCPCGNDTWDCPGCGMWTINFDYR